MVQYHLPCQNMVFFNHFFGVISCRVVVLLTQGELSFPPLSSFSSARLIAWHSARNQMTPFDVNFAFSSFLFANVSPLFICHDVLPLSPLSSSLKLACGGYRQVEHDG